MNNPTLVSDLEAVVEQSVASARSPSVCSKASKKSFNKLQW